MKTDKFEKTIRQKLESISPDFQERDWAKMQSFMQASTPPTFWQQYGSWLGYAAAASVTTVMALLYTGQLSQNNQLRTDVKGLQTQIEAIKQQPAVKPRTDTVYIVRTETIQAQGQSDYPVISNEEAYHEPRRTADINNSQTEEKDELSPLPLNEKRRSTELAESSELPATKIDRREPKGRPNISEEKGSPIPTENKSIANSSDDKAIKSGTAQENRNYGDALTIGSSIAKNVVISNSRVTQNAGNSSSGAPSRQNSQSSGKALGASFDAIEFKTPMNQSSNALEMQSALLNRISPKQTRKAWMAMTAKAYKGTESDKKTEQVTQAENVIPKLNIKLPYRFGAGMDWQKGVQNKTVIGEIIVAKNLSISTGVSWVKLKQMEFFSEKIFREANKADFKQSHSEVPKAFVVTNIKVAPSLVQIPLAIAFRNELKDDWAYYAGTGINITLNSKEAISYNCLVPNPRQDLLSQSFERKMNISPVNSVNFSFGLEKSFHPIVIQAEAYMYTYFKPLNPLHQRNGPGVKIKLLYQIGKKM